MNTPDFKDKIKRLAPSRPDKARPTVRVKGDRGFDPPRAAHSPLPFAVGRGGDNTLRVYSRKKVVCQFGEGIDECWQEHKNAYANAAFVAAACNNVERLAAVCELACKLLSEYLPIEKPASRKNLEHIRAALTQFELDRLQTP